MPTYEIIYKNSKKEGLGGLLGLSNLEETRITMLVVKLLKKSWMR